jgi:hypothetical protein
MSLGLLDEHISARSGPVQRRFVCMCIAAMCIFMIISGIKDYFFTLVPMEKKLAELEAKIPAAALESLLDSHAAVVSALAGSQDLAAFVDKKNLDRLPTGLKSALPDFLSIEAANHKGEVAAMVGDFLMMAPMSAAKVTSGNLVHVNSGLPENKGFFFDDPQNNLFYLTCRHVASDGSSWYTRTCFSRDSIEEILRKGAPATLMTVTGPKIDLTAFKQNSVKTSSSWWSGDVSGETIVRNSNCILTVKRTVSSPLLNRTSILLPLIILFGLGVALLFDRRANSQAECAGLVQNHVTEPENEVLKTVSAPQDSALSEELGCSGSSIDPDNELLGPQNDDPDEISRTRIAAPDEQQLEPEKVAEISASTEDFDGEAPAEIKNSAERDDERIIAEFQQEVDLAELEPIIPQVEKELEFALAAEDFETNAPVELKTEPEAHEPVLPEADPIRNESKSGEPFGSEFIAEPPASGDFGVMHELKSDETHFVDLTAIPQCARTEPELELTVEQPIEEPKAPRQIVVVVGEQSPQTRPTLSFAATSELKTAKDRAPRVDFAPSALSNAAHAGTLNRDSEVLEVSWTEPEMRIETTQGMIEIDEAALAKYTGA